MLKFWMVSDTMKASKRGYSRWQQDHVFRCITIFKARTAILHSCWAQEARGHSGAINDCFLNFNASVCHISIFFFASENLGVELHQTIFLFLRSVFLISLFLFCQILILFEWLLTRDGVLSVFLCTISSSFFCCLLVGRWKKLSDGFFLALSLSLSLSLSRPWRVIFFSFFSSAMFLKSMLHLQYVFVYDRSLHFLRDSKRHIFSPSPCSSLCSIFIFLINKFQQHPFQPYFSGYLCMHMFLKSRYPHRQLLQSIIRTLRQGSAFRFH